MANFRADSGVAVIGAAEGGGNVSTCRSQAAEVPTPPHSLLGVVENCGGVLAYGEGQSFQGGIGTVASPTVAVRRKGSGLGIL